MPKIFDKLNYKDQREIVVVNAPDAFEKELDALDGVRILRSLSVAPDPAFALLFVTRQNELDRLSAALAALLWDSFEAMCCDWEIDTLRSSAPWKSSTGTLILSA